MQHLKSRSNAKQRILDAAFEHFFSHGYEGASLSAIAELVGIRKASLYTHFASKEAIFMELLHDALLSECEFVQQCFAHSTPHAYAGEYYCECFKTRYEQSISCRFLIRMAYVPPVHLIETITENYAKYVDVLTTHIQDALHIYRLDAQQLELYSDAYLGIIDSLSVELLYAGQLYERRLNAMMMLYKNSLNLLSSQ